MIISKKKLKKYMEQIKAENRISKLGSDYTQPISEQQGIRNVYNQGYEDGTDNFYNAICGKFNIKNK